MIPTSQPEILWVSNGFLGEQHKRITGSWAVQENPEFLFEKVYISKRN